MVYANPDNPDNEYSKAQFGIRKKRGTRKENEK